MSTPAFVLVAPQMGENIGAAARVMGNFGLSDLRIVAPRDGWPNPRAEATAAGAFDEAVEARVFETVAEAVAEARYVLAATARPREIVKPVYGPREALARARTVIETDGRAAVMFGPEASGLTNEAVALADAIVTMPVAAGFSSLNLAQAVAVAAYEWRAGEGEAPPETFAREDLVASKDELVGLYGHLAEELDRVRHFWPEEKAEAMRLNLMATVTRARFTSQDVQTLRGVVKALANGPRRRRG